MQWPACYREAPFRANLAPCHNRRMHEEPACLSLSAPGVARCPALPVAAAWTAELRLELPGGTQTWSSEELLRHPQARDLDIPADVAYRRNMRYRAVPLAALLKGVHPEDHFAGRGQRWLRRRLPAARCSPNRARKPGWR